MQPIPELLALDWGTSSLRAYLLGADASTLAEKSAPLGILKVPGRDFKSALFELCGAWLSAHPRLPLIASGMIGSRQGWVEAPYVDCPADFESLRQSLAWAELGDDRRLAIVPGLVFEDERGIPDVMRGEETQIFGCLRDAGGGLFVLPGTHSKWAHVAQGRIERFATYLTGELFAVLKEHSILGRLMQTAPDQSLSEAFDRGWRESTAGKGDLERLLFSVRTLGLFSRIPAERLADYLSGLLIGEEIRAAVASGISGPVTLIGDADLCQRYARVLAGLGLETRIATSRATPLGLWRIATASGVLA